MAFFLRPFPIYALTIAFIAEPETFSQTRRMTEEQKSEFHLSFSNAQNKHEQVYSSREGTSLS